MLKFDFLIVRYSILIVSPPHFVVDFSRKLFLMLYSINWSNFIVWLPLHVEITGNTCIASIYFPGCDVINAKINLIFLKLTNLMTKKAENGQIVKFSNWPFSKIISITKGRRSIVWIINSFMDWFQNSNLKHFVAIFTGKHLGLVSLFNIKLQVGRPATLLERDFNTGVFRLVLWNF